MKQIVKISLLFFIFSLAQSAYAQINMADSSAQVIGYWNLNEKQSYSVKEEKIKIKETDTISREFSSYDVDITILDSTANSYTIEWFYHDYNIDTDNEITKELVSITDSLRVVIKTDELGMLQEVVNWEDIRSLVSEAVVVLQEKFKEIPNIDKVLNQVKTMFSSKEVIEAAAINEIKQYYSFHGAKYTLGEKYNANLKAPNIYGGEPFDSNITVYLDEINEENNNFILRTEQSIDENQLSDAVFAYICKLAENMGGPAPKKEDIPPVSNNTWTASRIHGSGWIIYSVQTKEVSADNTTNVEEVIIEIL
ncbi:hypothetical protein [Marinifilum caeruleilacunae]|uniref:Uncharacterized protein n=1 Tax=Marinifilum caeruleilacunae TaxID=2499076 RepID=A0ABX1X085_9BACT|nr:hypothetical protein [Marinifilum caeruleilacunae]NOU61828.1 hypothetical protein [Marinifilum caeruleilacunae]